MSYAPIISYASLQSVIYQEIIDEISRNDGGTLANQACAIAITEVQSHLARFNLIALFGDPVNNLAPTINDPWLVRLCLDIAAWHFIVLGNANLLYEGIESRYKMAKNTINQILRDELDPPGWPDALPLPCPTTSINVQVAGEHKRSNSF